MRKLNNPDDVTVTVVTCLHLVVHANRVSTASFRTPDTRIIKRKSLQQQVQFLSPNTSPSWQNRGVRGMCHLYVQRRHGARKLGTRKKTAPPLRQDIVVWHLFFCLALGTCAEKVQGAAISQLDVTCTGIPAAALHIKIPRQQSEDPCLAYPRWDLCPLTSLTARRTATLVRTNASCPSGSLAEVPSWIMECHWVGIFHPILADEEYDNYVYKYTIYICKICIYYIQYTTVLNLSMFIEWRNITKG